MVISHFTFVQQRHPEWTFWKNLKQVCACNLRTYPSIQSEFPCSFSPVVKILYNYILQFKSKSYPKILTIIKFSSEEKRCAASKKSVNGHSQLFTGGIPPWVVGPHSLSRYIFLKKLLRNSALWESCNIGYKINHKVVNFGKWFLCQFSRKTWNFLHGAFLTPQNLENEKVFKNLGM